MFPDFETEAFPQGDCVEQNPREAEVMDSATMYLCVVVDSRFRSECRVVPLRPYTCSTEGGTVLFGWVTLNGDQYVDHRERSIHDDHERVVAWKKIEVEPDFHSSFQGPTE